MISSFLNFINLFFQSFISFSMILFNFLHVTYLFLHLYVLICNNFRIYFKTFYLFFLTFKFIFQFSLLILLFKNLIFQFHLKLLLFVQHFIQQCDLVLTLINYRAPWCINLKFTCLGILIFKSLIPSCSFKSSTSCRNL